MMSLIAAAMAMPLAMQQTALAQIGPYVSRGHGKNRDAIGSHGGHMRAVRAARKARNVRRHRASSRG